MGDGSRLEDDFRELASEVGTAPLTEAEAAELLDLARVVAHSTQRKYAPLATYAMGLALGTAGTAAERAAAIRAAREAVERLRPARGEDPSG